MAKRRKKRSSGRRRRVGSTAALSASNPIVKYGSIVLGVFLSSKINKPIEDAAGTKLDGKVIGAAEGLAGYLLAFGKGKKSMLKTAGGGLLLGAGAGKLLSEFGISIPGLGALGNTYGRVPVIGNTYGRVPVIGSPRRIGAYTTNAALNGYNPNTSMSGQSNRVMAGVSTSNSSGSGITNPNGGNCMS